MNVTKNNIAANITNKFVAFLDVLGFSELVYNEDNTQLDIYFETVQKVLSDVETDKPIQSLAISDSIILIADFSPYGLRNLLIAINRIQIELLWKNIILRGAVSFGKAYYEPIQNIIVGKGYLRAFHLEKEAIFPRVIIDPSIISIFWDNRVDFINEIEERVLVKNYWEKKNHLIYYHSLFNNLPNDALFIDYLHNAFIPLSDEKEQVMYDFLKKNLYSEQKHQSKYQWLKAYYFECVKPELRSKSEMAKKLMQL